MTSSAAGIPSRPIVQCGTYDCKEACFACSLLTFWVVVSQGFISLRWFEYPLASSYRLTRNGTQIYTGATTTFIDTGVSAELVYVYTLSAEINSIFGADSAGLTVQALQLSQDSQTAICSSEIGVISMDDYKPSTTFSWQIKPNVPFTQLTLNVRLFIHNR